MRANVRSAGRSRGRGSIVLRDTSFLDPDDLLGRGADQTGNPSSIHSGGQVSAPPTSFLTTAIAAAGGFASVRLSSKVLGFPAEPLARGARTGDQGGMVGFNGLDRMYFEVSCIRFLGPVRTRYREGASRRTPSTQTYFQSPVALQPRGYENRPIRLRDALSELFPTSPSCALTPSRLRRSRNSKIGLGGCDDSRPYGIPMCMYS